MSMQQEGNDLNLTAHGKDVAQLEIAINISYISYMPSKLT